MEHEVTTTKGAGAGAGEEDVKDPTTMMDANEDDDLDVEDTATESYYDDDESGDEHSQFSYEDDDDGKPLPMPPLKYARIVGSLPRNNNNNNDSSGPASSSSPALSVKITSSAMGRVVVRPSPSPHSDKPHDAMLPSGSKHGGEHQHQHTTSTSSEWNEYYADDEEADMSMTKIHHVVALGFDDGKVRLIDALTGGSVLFGSSSEDGGAWYVNPSAAAANKRGVHHPQRHDPKQRIVALCFDSSSSYLAAMNENGDAAIFGPFMWGKQSRRRASLASGAGGDGGHNNHKFGFLASLTGKETDPANNATPERTLALLRPPFALVKPPASVRFTYADPQSFGSSFLGGGGGGSASGPDQGYHPTCLSLDPAYGRRKERALVVGFDDGRLILSKLQGATGIGSGITSLFGGVGGGGIGGGNAAGGGTAVKKMDTVLYQGAVATSFGGDAGGIEAVTWRGGLVAWADSSGVRLFDIESMSRIAHIPRPKGARSSLYPTISSSLRPSILFERSDLLLIGWGDCLMGMLISEVQRSGTASKDGAPANNSELRRKTVQNSFAWDLDCVACGVVPVDGKHVAVLGLVPSPSSLVDVDESEEYTAKSNHGSGHDDSSIAGGDNLLELQIINRDDGTCISNDRLPLLEGPVRHPVDQRIKTARATDFCLLSSFSCPRMDDASEWEALEDAEKEAIGRETGRNNNSSSSGNNKLLDSHLRWKLDDDICSVGNEIQSEAMNYDDQSVSSNCSVCSDNYVFVLSEPIGDMNILPDSGLSARPSPPIMTAIYSHDLCLVQTRDVDDAISYTRSLGKPALALKQALAHRRDVRRHGLDQLVDEYFIALLRMRSDGKERPLSFSRLKIAAESLPILLGGDPRMWQRWVFMVSKIQGGLFVIRDKIPVRDPSLPAFVFEMSLEKMLEETLSTTKKHEYDMSDIDSRKEELVAEKTADLFLETLRSWGPTSALRRRIQLYRYCAQNQQWGLKWHSLSGSAAVVPFIRQAEKDLHRRISQTAFGVLTDSNYSPSSSQNTSIRQYIDSTEDSLFDVDHLITQLAARLQHGEPDSRGSRANYDRSSEICLGNMEENHFVVVESMAELELMRERFDRALGYYLVIGSQLMADRLPSLEESAVHAVNSFCRNGVIPTENQQTNVDNIRYTQVLSLIELHQLSHILLKRNFIFSNKKDDSAAESPIVALIMLVGLSRAGRFLMDHCSPPEGTVTPIDSDEKGYSFSGSNLPIDLVAKQMESRPKLLYWFLFQVFLHKPDIYVKFPTTAVPPSSITDLHRKQFSLFVDYANDDEIKSNESDQTLAGFIDVKDTPFMAFLRAVTLVGGVRADDVREKLEVYRGGGLDNPVFARELAFVIETYGKGTVEDAREVLQLYLHGAKNLYMAVAFAERNTEHSRILWDMLIEHCTTPDPKSSDTNQNSALGALFGSLLEAAAHTGSDLASLVSRIPEGMSIEGLRPKLIAAITDYRYKVKIHEDVDNMLMDDKVSILRELSHLSRRGTRIEHKDSGTENTAKTSTRWASLSRHDLLKSQRAKASLNNKSRVFSLPIR